jgi:hypothetical protein
MRAAAPELEKELKPTPPKWTVSSLAKHMKVSRPTVRGWMNGTILPVLEQIKELEALFPRITSLMWLTELPRTKGSKSNEQNPNDTRRARRRRA